MPVSRPLSDTDELVSLIYSGPLESPPWGSFLDELGARMGARSAAIVLRLSQRGSPPLVIWGRRPDIGEAEARRIHGTHAELGHLDPLRNALDRPGAIHTLDEVVDRETLYANRFYREVLRPYGVEHQLGMYISEPGGWEGNIGLINGPEAPNFGPADKAMLTALRPHIERSLAIFARISREETELQALIDTLDRLTICTLILSGQGKILRANSAAKRMLAARSVAHVVGDRPYLTDQAANAQLQALIADALEAARVNTDEPFVQALRVDSRCDRHIGVLVKSIRPTGAFSNESSPAVVVYFAGSDDEAQPIERLVTQLFDLTPSEAHLATLLATGSCLTEAAEKLKLTENTVRTYCKTILNKVGVRRQTELVRLILRSVAVLG